jgi:hypothetical protein
LKELPPMLRVPTLPGSLGRVLEAFRPCFTTPTFTTFVTLLTGIVAQSAGRTVCGMLAGAGLAGVWHHSRAHRFFAAARWQPDAVGVTVLRLIIGHLVPVGAPLVVAVDDTMFRRCGRKVFAAHWGYDGSLKVAKGNQKLSRGNTFVIAAVVVTLPFLDRPVALPILARLWRKGGPAKTVPARELIEVIATATRGRAVHVVGDGAYLCTELRRLPPHVTLTGPLRSNASLWHVHADLDHPPRLRRRGRPRVYGTRIGTPADLAATVPGTTVTVTRYGRATTVAVHHQRCLWRGVFGARPVRVLVITEPGQPTLALVTTDPATPVAVIVERYAARWSIEVAFEDAKQITGVGEARNRTREAVERTVPFGLYTQSIVIVWYHLSGHHPNVIRDRRDHAPWYTTKKRPSYLDMTVKLQRVLIAAQYQPEAPASPRSKKVSPRRQRAMPADSTPRLAAAAQRRHEQTLARATAVLSRLERSGERVTYSGLAATAGVSRSWLYSQPDIRVLVDHLRTVNNRSTGPAVPTRQRTSEASLVRRLEAAQRRNQQLADQVSELRAQLAAAHGALRDSRAGRPSPIFSPPKGATTIHK